MRDAARLLINLKEESAEDWFETKQFLAPEHFDTVVKVAFKYRLINYEDLESYSTAIKLRYDIKRMTTAKIGIVLKKNNTKKQKKKKKQACMDFHKSRKSDV